MILVLGDAFVFLLFALLGLTHHRQPLTVDRIVHAALPFALAWFSLAPLLRAFHPPTIDTPKQALWRVPFCWLLCGIVGLLLRSWLWHRPLVGSFALVALLTTMVLLTVWRVAFAIAYRRMVRVA
ncbi:MAG: hypothetical protein SLRJCFUN_001201 [Candidatus Fervidibacter sp.]|jgi:hypothetical protein